MEQQEPSMEEILSSIRRILSHEEDVPATPKDDVKIKTEISDIEKENVSVRSIGHKRRYNIYRKGKQGFSKSKKFFKKILKKVKKSIDKCRIVW